MDYHPRVTSPNGETPLEPNAPVPATNVIEEVTIYAENSNQNSTADNEQIDSKPADLENYDEKETSLLSEDFVMETDCFELLSGKEVVNQADHFYRSTRRKISRKVGKMAFRVTKKEAANKDHKRVKVVITTRQNIELAMAMAMSEDGKAEEVLSKLREKPVLKLKIKNGEKGIKAGGEAETKKQEVKIKKAEVKEEPVFDEEFEDFDIPPAHIMEQVQAAMDKAMKEEIFSDEYDEDGYEHNLDDSFYNCEDSMDDAYDIKDVKQDTKEEYDNELDDFGNEPEDFDNDASDIEKQNFDNDSDYKPPLKTKRKRKRKLVTSGPKNSQPKIPNTLDKEKKLDSLNLDDYIVMVSADNSAEKKRLSRVKKEPRFDGEADQLENAKEPDPDKEANQLENTKEPGQDGEASELENTKEPGQDGEGSELENTKENEPDDDLYNINFGKTIKYYGCTFCDFTGKRMTWVKHLKSMHKDEGILFCKKSRICGHPFVSQDLLDQHIKESHDEKNKCNICNRNFKCPRNLRLHLKIHKSKEELEASGAEKHICPYCGKEFNTRTSYKTHEAQIHALKLNHKCDFEGCDKAFYKPSSLKIHRRSHTGEKPFICSSCGSGFAAKERLVAHEKQVHFKQEGELDTECHICQKKVRKSYLKAHIRTTHSAKPREKAFFCSFCGGGFISKKSLRVHEKLKHLTEESELNTECHICHKTVRKRKLKYHIETTHEGKNQDSCQVCGKIFPTTYARKRHEKIHFDIKEFSCQFCDKAFVQKANLESHERTHTGSKPYSCKYCDECFMQGTRRNAHQANCRQKSVMRDPVNH